MTTEAQANGLWCPLIRVSNGHETTSCTVNSLREVQENHCVASKCAMWRWQWVPHAYQTDEASGKQRWWDTAPHGTDEHRRMPA